MIAKLLFCCCCGVIVSSLRAETAIADVVDHCVDRRNATESDGNYYVIFCARRSNDDKDGVGHSFVVWAEQNERRQYSAAHAFGFYPESEKKLGILGPVPGDLKNEATEKDPKKLKLVTHRLTVQVNRKQWRESQARIKQWETQQYSLFQQNCVHFAYDVAGDLGLIVAKPGAELPATFLIRLIESTK